MALPVTVIFGRTTYCSPGTSDAVFEPTPCTRSNCTDWPASWLFAASCCDISSVSRPLTGSPVAFSSRVTRPSTKMRVARALGLPPPVRAGGVVP
jgi:hypothetical protein